MSAVDLVSVASPEQISNFLGHGVTPDLVERILDLHALRRHLSKLLDARLQCDASGDVKRDTALALGGDGITHLITCAGIVWHAAWIAGAIDTTARRELIGEIGEDHYRLALAARTSSLATPSFGESPETLHTAVAREGTGCIAAWRDVQPRQLADRLRLYWPSTSTTEAHRTFGPAIVDWLLARPPH